MCTGGSVQQLYDKYKDSTLTDPEILEVSQLFACILYKEAE
jgi:hypothetical protein